MLIEIREERPEDLVAIRDVNKRAFGQDQEGNIVDALRSNGAALGPMSVLPEHQRHGIGSKLVSARVGCEEMFVVALLVGLSKTSHGLTQTNTDRSIQLSPCSSV